jgi:hypothetical protein
MTRYLVGLMTATAALVAAVWLMVAPVAIGHQHGRHGWREATKVDVATGAAIALVAVVTMIAWAVAWRRRLRADGVLPERIVIEPDRPAEPEPPATSSLEDLLGPLVAALTADQRDARVPAQAGGDRSEAGVGPESCGAGFHAEEGW